MTAQDASLPTPGTTPLHQQPAQQDPFHRVPLMRPTMDEREVEAAARAIRSGWVTQGPEVAAFETEFAAFTGADHAVAVSNCTAALHLALLVMGVKPGDEVITASHSYIATANAITYCGATPVFVDVERSTHNIDASLIGAAVTDRTSAILAVHQMGMPYDVAAVNEVAAANGVPVVEDAACAAGSDIVGPTGPERIGRPHGDIACFSFHPRKVMSTGDGGMLTTGSAEVASRLRQLRQHGMTVDDRSRHGATEVVFESHPIVGFNYRMTDIQAAVGRAQLERLPEIVGERRRLADHYRRRLTGTDITLPHQPEGVRSNWQSFSVGLPEHCDQRAVMQHLLDAGVASRRGIMNAHREQSHRRPEGSLPVSEWCQDHTIVLPLFSGMTDRDLDHVAERLLDAVTRAKRSTT